MLAGFGEHQQISTPCHTHIHWLIRCSARVRSLSMWGGVAVPTTQEKGRRQVVSERGSRHPAATSPRAGKQWWVWACKGLCTLCHYCNVYELCLWAVSMSQCQWAMSLLQSSRQGTAQWRRQRTYFMFSWCAQENWLSILQEAHWGNTSIAKNLHYDNSFQGFEINSNLLVNIELNHSFIFLIVSQSGGQPWM